jgi:hypothetical protein
VQQVLSLIAGVLFVLAFLPYIRAIVKGQTKPAKASWIIWATLDTITLAGMMAKDAVNGQIIGAVMGATTVAILSFIYGKPGWTKLDKFCLAGAALGITLWQVFDSPTLGIVTSLSVVFLGSFPTFKGAYENPEQEDRTAWTIFWLSCVAAVLAVPTWDLDNASQPITFFAIESIMMWLLWKPRIKEQSLEHLNGEEIRQRQLYHDLVDQRPSWQSREDAERQLNRGRPHN